MKKYLYLVFIMIFILIFSDCNLENIKIGEIGSPTIQTTDTSEIEYKKLSKSYPKPNTSVNTSEELLNALSRAKYGDVVYISGTKSIDLTPSLKKIKSSKVPRFEIPAGVTLLGDGERFGENGATLLVTDDVKDEVFRLNKGANVIGLKIKGQNKDCDLIGLQAYISPEDTIFIENCEIWGWNNAAIRNRGDSNKVSLRNNMIVRNCYIHDNVFGTGYGISTAFNSYTLIEYNLFSDNRHDVSASGKYGCDYTYRYNINILQWTNPKTGKKAHIVDVHGWPFDAKIKPEDRKRN